MWWLRLSLASFIFFIYIFFVKSATTNRFGHKISKLVLGYCLCFELRYFSIILPCFISFHSEHNTARFNRFFFSHCTTRYYSSYYMCVCVPWTQANKETFLKHRKWFISVRRMEMNWTITQRWYFVESIAIAYRNHIGHRHRRHRHRWRRRRKQLLEQRSLALQRCAVASTHRLQTIMNPQI